jgi:hypothetical protein
MQTGNILNNQGLDMGPQTLPTNLSTNAVHKLVCTVLRKVGAKCEDYLCTVPADRYTMVSENIPYKKTFCKCLILNDFRAATIVCTQEKSL